MMWSWSRTHGWIFTRPSAPSTPTAKSGGFAITWTNARRWSSTLLAGPEPGPEDPLLFLGTPSAKERRRAPVMPGLDVVDEYRYLGVVFDSFLSWIPAKEFRAKQAKSRAAMVRIMGVEQGLRPDIASSLARAMVNEAGLYGAELYDDAHFQELDKIRLSLGRRILNVPRSFSKEATWGELGWWTTEGLTLQRRLDYWRRIHKSENKVTQALWDISKENATTGLFDNWCAATNRAARLIWGPAYHNSRLLPKNLLAPIIHTRQTFQWRIRMLADPSLAFYRSIKKVLVMEPYLRDRHDFSGRSLITKVRTGSFTSTDWVFQPSPISICRLCADTDSQKHALYQCIMTKKLRVGLARALGRFQQVPPGFIEGTCSVPLMTPALLAIGSYLQHIKDARESKHARAG